MDHERPLFVTISVTNHHPEGRSKQAKRNLPLSAWETAGYASGLLNEMGEELASRVGGESTQ
jgi:hypothetical protein